MMNETLPARSDIIGRLQKSLFDILIIEGGATGAGVALDATFRGHQVALVESGDFAGQTSSRSTKLLHGGVRYLEAAFTHLDYTQLSLVKSGLDERGILLGYAPHLTRVLPILIPVYSYFEAAYYWMGIKLYDWLAGKKTIGKSRFVPRTEVTQLFPLLKEEGLKGGILYHDGQFDDARMNLAVILTAIQKGAAIANYVQAVDFLKKDGRLVGAVVHDPLSSQEWPIYAKVVVNAAGPFADTIRTLDNPSVAPLLAGGGGSHLVFGQQYTPHGTGLLIPKTTDGRLLFLLPWHEGTLVGTTDVPRETEFDPVPTSGEVEYLLSHLQKLLHSRIDASEIKAQWCGIRPLIAGKGKRTTAQIPRDFQIEISASGLYSILGGKWTSFRKMAESLLDTIEAQSDLPNRGECQTKNIRLHGAIEKEEELQEQLKDWDPEVRQHLMSTYGEQSVALAQMAKERGLTQRLAEGYPYITGEVVWAVKNEYAQNVHDILFRRLPLGMLDKEAARKAVSPVVLLLAQELQWDEFRCRRELSALKT